MEFRTVLLSCSAFVCVALGYGCNSLDTSRQSLQLRPSDIVSTVFEPEYHVRESQVTATAVQNHFLFFSWGDADLYNDQLDGSADYDKPEVRRLKKAASAKACNAANCDLLVATTYQFQRTGFLPSTIRCTVRGFPTDVVSVSPMSSTEVTGELKRVQELDARSAPAGGNPGNRLPVPAPARPPLDTSWPVY